MTAFRFCVCTNFCASLASAELLSASWSIESCTVPSFAVRSETAFDREDQYVSWPAGAAGPVAPVLAIEGM